MIAAVLLAVLVLLAYAASLWWLLRGESRLVQVGLLALCGFALSARLLYTTDYPTGFIEDEPKMLASATTLGRDGLLLRPSATTNAVLPYALFQAPLLPLTGPHYRWAIRTQPLVTSILSIPVMFAVARLLGCGLPSSFAAAALIAVLPWSLFYARMMFGGEMIFHEMLLIAALAALCWGSGEALGPPIAIGGLGLCLSIYGYWAGMATLGLPFVAAVVAPTGRRRLACLAVLGLGVLGYAPYALNVGIWALPVESACYTCQWQSPWTWLAAIRWVFSTFVAPTGYDNLVFSLPTAAMHPLVVLVLAGLGVVFGSMRQKLFLLGGFVVGISPAVASGHASSHRMIMCFPFLTLAAAVALHRARRFELPLSIAVACVVAVQSLTFFFSSEFWRVPPLQIETGHTAVMEALPAEEGHPHLILDQNLSYYADPFTLQATNWEWLRLENYFPHSNTVYGYSRAFGPMRPFWEALVGAALQPVGDGFIIRLRGEDWSWLQQHGWRYTLTVPDQHISRSTIVPALFQPNYLTFTDIAEVENTVHNWEAIWTGPATTLQLKWSGEASVTVEQRPIFSHQPGFERTEQFPVRTNDRVVVTLATPSARQMLVGLYELPAANAPGHIPAWASVTPPQGPAS